MSARSREAVRLAEALTTEAGVEVEVRYGGRGWRGHSGWDVQWSGGPTEATIRQLVERLVPSVAPSFAGLVLAYSRELPWAAWARALITAYRAGDVPPRWQIEKRIRASAFPEVPTTTEEAELVDRLVRLGGGRLASEIRMMDLLATHGLSALGVGATPAGVVSIDAARRARAGSGMRKSVCPAAATKGVRITAATEGVADRAECPCGATWGATPG